ncbi:MAG TPA: HAMP domain-containing protein, partial [Candidatus Dormibacteraeota bacterium]|nr:HAMP domain-containing protein [Candidatus Dormibacteraeota bacterium]
MSLRARLAVLTGAAVAFAVVVGAILSYNLVRDQLYQQVDDSLRARISELTSFSVAIGDAGTGGGKQIQIVAQHPAGQTSGSLTCPAGGNGASPNPAPTPVPVPPGCTPPPTQSGNMPAFAGAVMAVGVPSTSLGAAASFTQFITSQGDRALSPGEVDKLPVNVTDRAVAAGRAPTTLRTDTIDGVRVRVATAQMPGAVASHGVAVMVARPLDETEAVLANLRELLVLIGAAGVALAAGLGVFVARTTMRPVRRLIAATDHVAGTRDLSRRIHVRGGSELDHLAMSFNDMLAALERSEATQRQLVADA